MILLFADFYFYLPILSFICRFSNLFADFRIYLPFFQFYLPMTYFRHKSPPKSPRKPKQKRRQQPASRNIHSQITSSSYKKILNRHIQLIRQDHLRYEEVDCISQYGLYETLNLF